MENESMVLHHVLSSIPQVEYTSAAGGDQKDDLDDICASLFLDV